ncbi:MyoD family inhibitor, partial [Dryobates pubescens]
LQNGAGRGVPPGGANGEAGNGVLRALPSSQKPHQKLQSHHSINSQSSKKSKGSSKSASSHIPIEAQEGQVPQEHTRWVLEVFREGSTASHGAEHPDCDLPCDMDCGIIDACCESADCLEICMECCGLCFSS